MRVLIGVAITVGGKHMKPNVNADLRVQHRQRFNFLFTKNGRPLLTGGTAGHRDIYRNSGNGTFILTALYLPNRGNLDKLLGHNDRAICGKALLGILPSLEPWISHLAFAFFCSDGRTHRRRRRGVVSYNSRRAGCSYPAKADRPSSPSGVSSYRSTRGFRLGAGRPWTSAQENGSTRTGSTGRCSLSPLPELPWV